MSWPLSQEYNEAVQDPRGNFSDAELKTGEAATNALGIPMPRSGNFADVYEVRCPSGRRWAVKCFTREVHGLRERYAEISSYLHQVNLPFIVDFQYLERGIRVRNRWFPILKMQWVEGFVLNEFVRDNLDRKPILLALEQIWVRMARRLRKAELAHGDLQHGNVLFVPANSANSLAVKLIDYDGMCVPSLAGKNSGEVGHPAFQHPERLRTGVYNQEVDRFSLLSIAAALHCLTIGGRSLWERYDNGDNLLFRQADLQAPAESPLFRELMYIDDPQTRLLVTELYRACQGPLSHVPLLMDLLPEERPTGKATMAVANHAGALQETDWNFGDDDPDAPIIRKRREARRMPLWIWGMLGGVAALLLSVGVGADLFPRKTADKKDEAPVAPRLTKSPWSHLDLPRDLVPHADDSVLRIPNDCTIPTRQKYSGPLDITIETRGPRDQDVSFIAPGGAMVTFRYDRKSEQNHVLVIRRPDKSNGEPGTMATNPLSLALEANKWNILHWEIKSTGMEVSINDRLFFRDTEDMEYNLTAKYPVMIRVNQATIEVKSVTVKSIK